MSYASSALYFTGFLFLFAGTFALTPVIVMSLNDGERRAEARLRKEGARAQAIIKSFLRRSMTQHCLLLEVRLPSGSIGRELLVSG
jgi:hypothetical protein